MALANPEIPDPLAQLGEVPAADPEVLDKARAKLRALIEQENRNPRRLRSSGNRSAEAP
jgi:hypothetical protein